MGTKKIWKRYTIAIEERARHQQNFNYWMNMYAIFNSALFVGYYSSNVSSSTLLRLAVLLLGCVSGWFWHFSVRGFYDWIISWIRVVQHYEQLAKEEDVKKLEDSDKSNNSDNLNNSGNSNDSDKSEESAKDNDNLKDEEWKVFGLYAGTERNPFSTQRLTRRLTFCIALAWSGLTVHHFIQQINVTFMPAVKLLVQFGMLFLTVAVVLISRSRLAGKYSCLEDLRRTHTKL